MTKEMRIYIVWSAIIMLALASIFVWSTTLANTEGKILTVVFLDVGQGDAIYIETPNGVQVLVDGGKGRAVLRELGAVMPFYDRSIDVVLATHPDLDHIGGLPEVFARYDVSMFIEPGVRDGGADNRALQEAVRKEKLEPVHARKGMVLALDEDVSLHILFPDRDATLLEANTGSIVTKLVYKETSFLLTGDSPKGIEEYLVSMYGDALQSDVLKLGHHGSRTSTGDSFLGFVSPKHGIISASCDNSYGHPHTEVLERLEKFEVKQVSTCKDGTVRFESDGARIMMR